MQNPVILTINIGNDVIQIGLSHLEESLEVWHVATPNALTSDEANIILDNLFRMSECHEGVRMTDRRENISNLDQLEGAIVASVVPALTDAWVQAAKTVSKSRPLVVGPGLKTGLRMNYNDPAEIGADRIADLVAAKTLFNDSFIIVDLGTTTNFSVVDSEGAFCGGIIAPGLRLSAEALSKGAARLHTVDIKEPSSVIGKNTSEALRSGIIMGEVAKIDGLIEQIWGSLGYTTDVVGAGLGISEIAALTKHVNRVEENLTMRGLRILYAMNRRAKSSDR